MAPLNVTPLSTPVSNEEIAAFKREARTGGGDYSALAASSLTTTVVTIILALFAVGLFVFFVFGTIPTGSGRVWEIVTLVIVAAAIIVATIVIRTVLSRATWRRWLKLTRFATANDLSYSANSTSPGYPGSIFGLGQAQTVPEHFYRSGNRFLDIGNYRYTTGSGKNKKTHNWGYLAIKLDRMLPQMVLDAKSNNFLGTNLPVRFSRNQSLSLEGDFDRYFTLYCPKEYERDALYVFTPDLMALLIDEAARFDVEIVDDWMFIYSSTTFNLANAQLLSRLFRIIDTVGQKTLSRTELYADSKLAGSDGAALAAGGLPLGSRMATNQVASQGRRLKRGVPIATIVVMIALVVFWAINFLPQFRGV